jgi:hypothetical protein
MRNKLLSVAMLALVLAIGSVVSAHDHGKVPYPTPTPPSGPTATPTPSVFSDASVNGTYSTKFHGFLLIPGATPSTPPALSPVAGFGTATADGMGNITGGSETFNAGGSVCTGAISGTYSVNADGTGTWTVTFTSTGPGANCASLSGTQDADFVIRGMGGHHLEYISTDPGSVISGTASEPHPHRYPSPVSRKDK